jgi:NADPH-dependent 2,4-dienoyl-CoA reductase/sulfur reductase-like enzyme
VLVAGGGPAGVAAALEAAAAGHAVVLTERSAQLGGQLRVAGRAPAHRETWERYERWIAHRLTADGVEVRLGAEVAPDDAGDYDAVIVATGATPYLPPLPAGTPFAVLDALAAILAPARGRGPGPRRRLGRRLDRPRRRRDASPKPAPRSRTPARPRPVGEGVHQYQRNLYLARLDRLGVAIVHHTEVDRGRRARLRHVFSGRTTPLPEKLGDARARHGRAPDDALWRALEGGPAASAPATCSARAAPRRRSSRGRSPRARRSRSARLGRLRRRAGAPARR